MTTTILTIAAFCLFLAVLTIVCLRSLRKQSNGIPSYRITIYGIRCEACGQIMQSGKTPFATTVCKFCK